MPKQNNVLLISFFLKTNESAFLAGVVAPATTVS